MKERPQNEDEKSKELLESNGDDITTNADKHLTSNINTTQMKHFLSWASEVFRSVKKLSQAPVDTTQANDDTTSLRNATNPALDEHETQHGADESMSFKSEVHPHKKRITIDSGHSSDKSQAFDTGKLSPTIKKFGFKHNNVDNPEILKKETDVDNIEPYYSDLMY